MKDRHWIIVAAALAVALVVGVLGIGYWLWKDYLSAIK